MLMQPSLFVDADLYESEEAVVEDALRSLWRNRPDIRIQLAIHRYKNEDISVGKAAQIAGMSWPQMCDLFKERGVELRLGAESFEEAQREVAVLDAYFN